jgi:hypothetical protein
MIAVVALGKDSSKTTLFYAFIIIFNICLKYGFRKIIILMNNDSEKNFIFQRFVKENDLISNLMKYIKEFIDGHAIIIYGKHDLITHIKDSGN